MRCTCLGTPASAPHLPNRDTGVPSWPPGHRTRQDHATLQRSEPGAHCQRISRACPPGGRSGEAKCSITSRRPPNAPTGKPPPMTLPRQMNPAECRTLPCAPPRRAQSHHRFVHDEQRAVPAAKFVRCRQVPSCGRTRPMFPATPSMMTAAMCSPSAANTRSSAAKSLYGTVSVSAAISAGMPGLSGAPNVAAPEPALTSRPSLWPW